MRLVSESELWLLEHFPVCKQVLGTQLKKDRITASGVRKCLRLLSNINCRISCKQDSAAKRASKKHYAITTYLVQCKGDHVRSE